MDKHSLKQINEGIIKTDRLIQDQIERYTGSICVILIGNTGCGKSSLLNSLTNRELIVSEYSSWNIMLKGPGIQSGSRSYTNVPNIVEDPNSGIFFCDCPGFDGTDDIIQEIINSFAIDSLFSNISKKLKFKILLTVSESEYYASRGQHLVNCFNRLSQMFPNDEYLKSTGLVITKCEKKLQKDDIIDLLENYLDSNKSSIIQYFCSNPDDIFTFPMPDRSEIGQKYTFNDHQRIINFIQKEQTCEIKHHISLSESSYYYLKTMKNDLEGKTKEEIRNLFEKIYENYSKENNENVLNNWKEKFILLKQSPIQNVNELKTFCQNNFQINYCFDSLKEFENMIFFINRAENIKSNCNSILQKSLSQLIDHAISDLEILYTKALNKKEHEKNLREMKCYSDIKKIENLKQMEVIQRYQNVIDTQKRIKEENKTRMIELRKIQYQKQLEIFHLKNSKF